MRERRPLKHKNVCHSVAYRSAESRDQRNDFGASASLCVDENSGANHSLFGQIQSLFRGKFSLFRYVGNLAIKTSVISVLGDLTRRSRADLENIPCIFPV